MPDRFVDIQKRAMILYDYLADSRCFPPAQIEFIKDGEFSCGVYITVGTSVVKLRGPNYRICRGCEPPIEVDCLVDVKKALGPEIIRRECKPELFISMKGLERTSKTKEYLRKTLDDFINL